MEQNLDQIAVATSADKRALSPLSTEVLMKVDRLEDKLIVLHHRKYGVETGRGIRMLTFRSTFEAARGQLWTLEREDFLPMAEELSSRKNGSPTPHHESQQGGLLRSRIAIPVKFYPDTEGTIK